MRGKYFFMCYAVYSVKAGIEFIHPRFTFAYFLKLLTVRRKSPIDFCLIQKEVNLMFQKYISTKHGI